MKKLFLTTLMVILVATMAWAGIGDRFSNINLTDKQTVEFPGLTSDPDGNPAVDKVWLFAKNDNLYMERDTGEVILIYNKSDWQPGAKSYYVDGNKLVSGDGTSWESAYITFAEAVTASNAYISSTANRQWATRNLIYIKGDDLVATIATLPEKCDVIGVGSSDNYPYACIRGNHAPVNGKMGCRFYNVRFRPAASATIWTLASTTGGGLEFNHCMFDANYGAFTAPSAIDTTAAQFVVVNDSDFIGTFSGDVIDIGAGSVNSMKITGNRIMGGANDGVVVTDTTTIVQGRMGLIADNYIQVAGVTIDDGADSTFNVIDNRCISATTYGAGSHVITVANAAGNIVVAQGVAYNIPSTTD